jgi:hypothetical protein
MAANSVSVASAPDGLNAHNRKELEEALSHELLELFCKMLTFPQEAQQILGQLLLQFTQRIRDMQALQLSLRSAGADRLLLYLKVQALWPEVANSKTLGKALKSTLLLDAMGQSALCFKVGETIGLIELYLDLCQKKHLPVVVEQLESLILSSLMQGGSDARQVARFLFKP